jgi:16S rRNA (guanine527-N7)-methyltransferase
MPPPDNNPFGAEEFAAATGVSRETMTRLKLYAGMLEDWNARHNLVSRASLADMWRRHFWDSAQLAPLIPKRAKSLVDLGAGAGFPGLVLAELFRDRPGFRAVLYEATAKKCRFLEAVTVRLALAVEIRNARIEDAEPEHYDVIVARACAPLPLLLEYAQRFWGRDTKALFLKGQNVDAELTEARKSWKVALQRHPSRSDPSGVILELRELHHVAQRSHSRD